MQLAVFSYKACWPSESSPTGYATDGGFPIQMRALSELFNSTTLVLPVISKPAPSGLTAIEGKNLSVTPLPELKGEGFKRKLRLPLWLASCAPTLCRQLWRADAIHAPIPGDIGTLGMIGAQLLLKPLFVRHCGNWLVQATAAERFWKWHMERFAGGRNVMLATGGGLGPPSTSNPHVEWIFSTSLGLADLERVAPKSEKTALGPRLIIAARQDPEKGAGVLIEALSLLKADYPQASLDIVGEGSGIPGFRQTTERLGLVDRVRFHGRVSHAQVVELLQQADLFGFPTAASDGFPKAVHEGLACGLPVIATKVSVLPSLLSQGGGVLVDERTPEAIALAVRSCISSTDRYQMLSRQAVELAKRYTLEGWRDEIGGRLERAWGRRLCS